MTEYSVILPMRFRTSAKKKTALNLNVYRNLHFRSLTKLKHMFHDNAKKLLQDVPPLGRIQLKYEVFVDTKRLLDIGNVCSIVDKFFCDSLTTYGIIEDDNYHYLDQIIFRFGGQSAKEHVLATITEIEPRKDSIMRTNVVLDLSDFETEASNYLKSIGVSGLNVSVVDGDVSFDAITDGDAAASPTPVKKNRGGRPAGSKNKPVAKETDDVATPPETGDGDNGAGDAKSPEVETEAPSTKEKAADVSEKPEPEKAKSSSAKNLFAESPGESSTTDEGDSAQKTEDDSQDVAPKKSSIFDQ